MNENEHPTRKGDYVKVFFITNMNVEGSKGGLFNATYERIKIHKKRLEQVFVTNINIRNSTFVRFIKKFIFNKNINKISNVKKHAYRGVEIYNLNFKLSIVDYFRRYFFKQNLEKKLVQRYIKEFDSNIKKSDIIHAHWGWPNGYIAYKLSEIYSIPYFVTFHGSDINYLNEKNKKKMLTAMEHANKCFFVSEELYANAKKIGYTGHNKAITYNGVDLELFRITNQSKHSGKKIVGYIGSLEKKKGVDYLVSIFKSIAAKKDNVEFKIIGDGNLLQNLQKDFEMTAPDVKVDFTGELDSDQIPINMNLLDVLVVPSRNEGLGMVALEANACGTPVVGSNAGGLPEAIGYSENIINMGKEFTDNIADRVIKILEGDTLTQEEYRERVKRKFNWDYITDFEFETYKSAVKEYKSLKKKDIHER